MTAEQSRVGVFECCDKGGHRLRRRWSDLPQHFCDKPADLYVVVFERCDEGGHSLQSDLLQP